MSFDTLGLSAELLRAVSDQGYSEPTPVQRDAIPVILEGKDVLAGAQTGTGKTAGFTLPLLQRLSDAVPTKGRRPVRALVLTPTRELAAQVAQSVDTYGKHLPLTACVIFGGVKINPQIARLRAGIDIVVATPGRLLDHVSQKTLDLSKVEILVLDEADRMLDMGFRDDVTKIAGYCAADRQVLMLSATPGHRGVKTVAKSLLKEPRIIAVGESRQPHSSIFHQLILADSQEHKDKLLAALLRTGGFQRALIFGNKRTTAVRLANLLRYHDFRCGCLQGDMSTEERKHVMHQFHEGKVDIVCASDVAARGLDVKGIDLVVNYDMPHSGDDYLHRTGRTGRAGAQGLAVSLVTAIEWNLMISIERYLKLEFERRTLPGLKARYAGPKKVKSSGKAAGSKKKRSKTTSEKSKTRKRNQKNHGKRRAKSEETARQSNDGFAPLMKKKPTE